MALAPFPFLFGTRTSRAGKEAILSETDSGEDSPTELELGDDDCEDSNVDEEEDAGTDLLVIAFGELGEDNVNGSASSTDLEALLQAEENTEEGDANNTFCTLRQGNATLPEGPEKRKRLERKVKARTISEKRARINGPGM